MKLKWKVHDMEYPGGRVEKVAWDAICDLPTYTHMKLVSDGKSERGIQWVWEYKTLGTIITGAFTADNIESACVAFIEILRNRVKAVLEEVNKIDGGFFEED